MKQQQPEFDTKAIFIGGIAVVFLAALFISAAIFIIFSVGETVEYFTP